MKNFCFQRIRNSVLPIFAAVLLTGCASSMQSPKEELKQLGKDDGIVIGSALITVEKPASGKSDSWLNGRKSGGSSYVLSIEKNNALAKSFAPGYSIEVTPEQKETFIKKLPEGDYVISEIRQTGFSNLKADVNIYFSVVAGQTTYIGGLVVKFPGRLMMGDRLHANVTDEQDSTVNSLKQEYADFLTTVNKRLMQAR